MAGILKQLKRPRKKVAVKPSDISEFEHKTKIMYLPNPVVRSFPIQHFEHSKTLNWKNDKLKTDKWQMTTDETTPWIQDWIRLNVSLFHFFHLENRATLQQWTVTTNSHWHMSFLVFACVFRWHRGPGEFLRRGPRGEPLAAVRQQQPPCEWAAVGFSAVCGEDSLWLLLVAEVRRVGPCWGGGFSRRRWWTAWLDGSK